MTDTKYFWVGGILPLIGTVGILFVVFQTNSFKVSDILIAALGIVTLLVFWGSGNDRHNKKLAIQKKEMISRDVSKK